MLIRPQSLGILLGGVLTKRMMNVLILLSVEDTVRITKSHLLQVDYLLGVGSVAPLLIVE